MHISTFIKQKSYEHIEYVLRRHPITFVPTLAFFVVLLGVPIVLYFMINQLFPDFVVSPQIHPVLILGASAYYLSIYLFFFAQFIDYYLDLWIVTNDRIIDTEQHGLFHRVTTELDLYRIQDVTSHVQGFFGTLFKYGDLHVKTASSNTLIVFRQIPNPELIRERLIHLADEDRKFHTSNIETDPTNN